MEDFVEDSLRILSRFISFIIRMLVWLLKDLFIELIGWYVGWPIVRVLTLGRYPEEGIHDSGEAGTLIYCIVSLTGLIVLGALGFSLL